MLGGGGDTKTIKKCTIVQSSSAILPYVRRLLTATATTTTMTTMATAPTQMPTITSERKTESRPSVVQHCCLTPVNVRPSRESLTLSLTPVNALRRILNSFPDSSERKTLQRSLNSFPDSTERKTLQRILNSFPNSTERKTLQRILNSFPDFSERKTLQRTRNSLQNTQYRIQNLYCL